MIEHLSAKAHDYFVGKRVLITGGCGFIASHLARRLSQCGAEIRLFDYRDRYDGEFEFVSGDVRDSGGLERATRGCDIVFHCAALLGVEKILKIPLEVLEVNEKGTVNALKAAVRNDVERFVLASSSEIYGEPRKVPITEDTPPSPCSIYGVSKLAAESYSNAYALTTGLKVTCLRFFNVYGPGQAEEFVVSRFVSRVARRQPPIIYGTGEQVRAYTYVSDAVEGVLLAASHPNGVNETFNVGSKECASVAELARLLIEISGEHLAPIQKGFGDGIRSAQREIYTRIPDTSKAEKLLGFQSRTPLREGLTRCYKWYLSGGPSVPHASRERSDRTAMDASLVNLPTPTIRVKRKPRLGGFGEDETKSVLVIGGAGYIGSILVRELLRKGYHVRLLDILLYGDAPIADLCNHPRFGLIQGDFRYIDVVARAMRDMDAVIHLGAIVGDPACAIDEELTLQINLAATRVIAQVAKGYGVERLLFASTYSVYGAAEEIVDERSALNALSLYARTKIASERVLLSLSDARFSPVILRLATVFGMSYRPRFDLLVNLLTARAVTEKCITIIEGDQWRSFVHVRDVADAFLQCLEAPLENVKGQFFNVGSNDHNYRICQLGDLVKKAVPDVSISYQDRVEDRRNCRVCFDKIQHELGFRPRRTPMDGILEIKRAIETGEVTDCRSRYHSNYRFLAEDDGLERLRSSSQVAPLAALLPPRPGKLQPTVQDAGGWEWIKLSVAESMAVAEIVVTVIESQSQELMSRLRESLVQAMLGDIDGFLNTLTGMQLTAATPAQAASAPERQPEFVKARSESKPKIFKSVSA